MNARDRDDWIVKRSAEFTSEPDADAPDSVWQDWACCQIDIAAERHGWGGDYHAISGKNWRTALTGSRYCELSRPFDDYESAEYQTIRIRVANHATAYCREDWSIVRGGGSADDHTLDSLLEILSGPFVADDY